MLLDTLPMATYTYTDNGLTHEVVDVMKLYPEILNSSYWRDATYQLVNACDRFHPYIFSKDIVFSSYKS